MIREIGTILSFAMIAGQASVMASGKTGQARSSEAMRDFSGFKEKGKYNPKYQ